MVKIYAILDSNDIALNFISWDGVSNYDYGASIGNKIIEIPEGVQYGFGWKYVNGEFVEQVNA